MFRKRKVLWYIDGTYMCNILIGSILKSIFDPNVMIFTTTMLEMLVELLDGFRMKQTKMYVCTLVEFILDDLHYLMYKMELRYCVEITLVFIQSQQWMRNVRIALRSQLTSED